MQGFGDRPDYFEFKQVIKYLWGEKLAGGRAGNSTLYHKESSSLSLTPGTDHGHSSPAASLAKKERKTLWFKPQLSGTLSLATLRF